MAVGTATLVAAYDGTDRTAAYTTASHTPTANRLVLAWVWTAKTTTPPTPTLSGNGLTWVQIHTITNGAVNRRLTLFRAMGGSPSTGVTTITHDGTSIIGCAWVIAEFSGVNTSGTNGSGAIVQDVIESGVLSVTSDSADLAAFSNTANATAACIVVGLNETVSVEGGYTSLGNPGGTVPNLNMRGQFLATNDTTPTFTWTTSSSNFSVSSVEIKGADQNVSPSVLTSAITFPTPTAQGPANVTPSVLTSATVFPAPTIRGTANVTPAVLAAPIVFPAPTIRGTANVTPSVLTSAVVFPAPTARGPANVTPAVLAAPIVFPAPTITGTANVTPSVLAAPIVFLAPTVTGTANVAPAVLAAPITFPAPTVTGAANVTPATLVTAIVFPEVTAIGTIAGDATATPDPISTSIVFQAPAVSGDANVAPAVLEAPITFPAPTATGETGTADGTAFPETLGMAISFPQTVAVGDFVEPPTVPARGAAKLEPVYAVHGVARPLTLSLTMRFPPSSVTGEHDWSFEDEEILLLI